MSNKMKPEPAVNSLLIICTLLTISLGVARAGVVCKDGSNIANTIIVDQSSNKFATVQSAIDSIPADNNRWIKIHIKAGTYKEQVTIPVNKPCIFLEGEGSPVTKITYDGHDKTDTSATFTSIPENVVVKGITLENSYNLAEELLQQLDSRNSTDLVSLALGNEVKQALAARIYGDKSAFYNCSFVGVQDTLWDVRGRHFFRNCYIEGAIDFIFGNGQSIYQDCSVNSTIGSLSDGKLLGFITAQGRQSKNDPSGFVFRGGNVVGRGQTYLGRAYGPYSRVIFNKTWLSSVVAPLGWNAWHFSGEEHNFMYAEINCQGPGSDKSERVPWEKNIDPSIYNQFSTQAFINQDGWLDNQPK